jgi:hypothetical protein
MNCYLKGDDGMTTAVEKTRVIGQSWVKEVPERSNVRDADLECTDISFYNLGDDLVEVRISIGNQGDLPSAPSKLSLRAAPLGAFVATQPLRTLAVPSLEPHESITLTTEASSVRQRALGAFVKAPCPY